jgi:peptidoglycan/LPS O-acetylase OafA/YrhL
VYALSLALVVPFILADQAQGKAGFAVNYALLLQGWSGYLPVGWNTPAWSLSCEVFFYVCFPLAVVALSRIHPLAIMAIACLLSRVLLGLGIHDAWKPLVHFADFLMGIAAASVYGRLRNRLAGYWLYVPGVAAGAALIAWPHFLPFGIDLNSALRPLNALVLVGLALGARLLSSPVAVYLGKSSYAMYILHVPLLWWMNRWRPHHSAGLYLAAVILISALVYRYWEEPANRFIRGKLMITG